MGSRIGYCFRKGKERSPILRMQWQMSIKELVSKTWKSLGELDSGSSALRDDLCIERAICNCVVANAHTPFDKICTTTNCDISDNGLIEIDVGNYKEWHVWHIDIECEKGKEGRRTEIAEITPKGFKWIVSAGTLERLGEGLC